MSPGLLPVPTPTRAGPTAGVLAQALAPATRTDLVESARAYLAAAHGVDTWYLLRTSPFVFDSAFVEPAGGEAAYYNAANLVVHFGPEATRALDAFRTGDRSPRALGGLRTVLHELWHATSRMHHEAPLDYARHAAGRLVEEGVAEHRARQAVAADFAGGPDYRPLMDDPAWAPFFGSRSLEANGVYALAAACGEFVLDAAWARPDAGGRAAVVGASVARIVGARLAALGAGHAVVEAEGPGVAARGYRLLLDKDASQPYAARRPEDVPLAAFLRAGDLPDALAILHAPGMIPEPAYSVRGLP